MKKVLVFFAFAVVMLICVCIGGKRDAAAYGGSGAGFKVYRDVGWQNGGEYCEKFIIPIKNSGRAVFEGWSLNIFFSEEIVGIENIWNGRSAMNGRVIRITPMDYNNAVYGGGVTEVGFIARFKQRPEILASAIYVNGERIGAAEECAETTTEGEVFEPKGETPFKRNGKLSVKGRQLVNGEGENVILQGISTHGIAWYPQYVNLNTFKWLNQNMNADVIRLALYSSAGEGYKAELYSKVAEGIKYAEELGMYVIVDWHVLGSGNPNNDKAAAKEFFGRVCAEFGEYDNILYEICNEPNGDVLWERDIKPYAKEIIPIIRAYDKDAIIIVGTPEWSQDVDIVAESPIEGYENIMYAFHFYAATHGSSYRDKVQNAYDKGLPVFVTEFGSCDASGNGVIDEKAAEEWIDFLRQRGISYVCWNLSNKDEAAALIENNCQKLSDWTDKELSPAGRWLKKIYCR